MTNLIVEHTGYLDRAEKAPGCMICCGLPTRPHKRDGVWSWIVCMVGVLSIVIVIGIMYTFGVIYPTLLDEFKEGKAKTALVGSLASAGMGIYGPVVGKFIDLYGTRNVAIFGSLTCAVGLFTTCKSPNIYVMFLTYSVVYGFGASCVYFAVFVTVPTYFNKWQPCAIGLISAGLGAGMFVLSPILQELLNAFGWRGAYVGQAALCLVVCVFAICLEQNQKGETQTKAKVNWNGLNPGNRCGKMRRMISLNFSFWKSPKYPVLVTSIAVLFLGYIIPVIHMARHSENMGLTADEASQLYLYFGLCSLISRAAAGPICNRKWLNPVHLYRVAAVVCGVATNILPFLNTYVGLLLYAFVFGLTDGFMFTPANIMIMNALKPHQRAQGFGTYQLFLGIATGIGPYMGGFFADEFGTYAPTFHVAGTINILAVFISFLLCCVKTPTTKVQLYSSSFCEKVLVTERVSVL